jgi:hypothetical protein
MRRQTRSWCDKFKGTSPNNPFDEPIVVSDNQGRSIVVCESKCYSSRMRCHSVAPLLAFSVLSFFASSPSEAADLFTGEGRQETTASQDLSTNDVRGLQFLAIRDALTQCRTAGNERCAIKHVLMTRTNRAVRDAAGQRTGYLSTARARIQSLDRVPLALEEKGVFTQTAVWRRTSRHFSDLEVMGIEHGALKQALDECYGAGSDFCTILETGLIMENELRPDPQTQRPRFRTEAQAVVKGFYSRLLTSPADEGGSNAPTEN